MEPKEEIESFDNIGVDFFPDISPDLARVINNGEIFEDFQMDEPSSQDVDISTIQLGLPAPYPLDPCLNIPSTSSTYSPQVMAPTLSQPHHYMRLTASDLPLPPPDNKDWPGPYGFHLVFLAPEKNTKNAPWTFSESRNKLFVTMDSNCPIKIVTNFNPPAGSVLKITAVFVKPECSLRPVERCLNHLDQNDETNKGHHAPDHLIRCESQHGLYSQDERGHKILTVPFTESPEGFLLSTYIFKFMCWSSCVGGMNRRAIKVIFSLEHQGMCLGRHTVAVKICACPGRDRKKEEKYHLKVAQGLIPPSDDEKSDATIGKTLKRGKPAVTGDKNNPPPSKKKKTQNGRGPYVLMVEKFRYLQFLKVVLDNLRTMDKTRKDTSTEEE